MADWKVLITVVKENAPVAQAAVIVGSLGEFIANGDGIAEVEIEQLAAGLTILEAILVTAPNGAQLAFANAPLVDAASYTIDFVGSITED